jgi:myo-inositol-1(or 4)-monophosphatase
MTATLTAEEAALYAEIEALAVDLAREAGAEVTRQLELEFHLEYKTDLRGRENSRDPVSAVDRAVEELVRERIGAGFPDHAIVGEETDEHPDASTEYVWVIDPVDGTTNFVNGFPLFAVSIGVLRYGVPVAGAIWCSTTHAIRAGVYHARAGSPLYLDGVEVTTQDRPVKRRLAAAPGGASAGLRDWDHRVTGSMAIEGAYVAAGIFTHTTLWGAWLWDVAAAVLLVQATGGEAWIHKGGSWQPFERFEPPTRLPRRPNGETEDRAPSLRDWRQPMLLGTPETLARVREQARPPGWFGRQWRRYRRWRRERRS